MQENNFVIEVDDLGKKFSRSLRKGMVYSITDACKNMFSIPYDLSKLRETEFWALNDISFKVRKGEKLGIIGSNGSGKSTLFRLLSGIYPPDAGTIKVKGSIAPLIAVGAGFHPHMTGLENIFLNGTLLGMTKENIRKNLDAIIEFADLGEFINAPFSTYSSGMKVRLGFSIAIFSDDDILLIDEVLSVGDVAFRVKSRKKMMDLIHSGKTVLFVSHDMMAMEELCDQIIWLERGIIKEYGSVEDVISKYMKFQRNKAITSTRTVELGDDTGYIFISDSYLIDENGNRKGKGVLKYGERMIVRLHYEIKKPVETPYFMVYVKNFANDTLFHSNMLADGGEPRELVKDGYLDIDFGNPTFLPGSYSVRCQIRKDSQLEHFRLRDILTFDVDSSPEDYGFVGKFNQTYTFGPGMSQAYKYSWSD